MLVPSFLRRGLPALLACAALSLQLALPGLHPQHGEALQAAAGCDAAHADAASRHGDDGTSHDGVSCSICATIAQGRALALCSAAAAPQAAGASDAPRAPRTPLLAAPTLTRAAPRAPPVLA